MIYKRERLNSLNVCVYAEFSGMYKHVAEGRRDWVVELRKVEG